MAPAQTCATFHRGQPGDSSAGQSLQFSKESQFTMFYESKNLPLYRCRSQDSDQSTIRLVQLVGGIVHHLLHPKTVFSKSKKARF